MGKVTLYLTKTEEIHIAYPMGSTAWWVFFPDLVTSDAHLPAQEQRRMVPRYFSRLILFANSKLSTGSETIPDIIIWSNGGLLFIRPFRRNFTEIWNRNTAIFIRANAFYNNVCKMAGLFWGLYMELVWLEIVFYYRYALRASLHGHAPHNITKMHYTCWST